MRYKKAIIIIPILLFAFLALLFLKFASKSDSAGISIQEFEKINMGMTQFKVNSIIDNEDKWDDDEVYNKYCEEISSSNHDHVYTYVYKYYGERKGYAIITFEADYTDGYYGLKYPEVVKKEKFDLK